MSQLGLGRVKTPLRGRCRSDPGCWGTQAAIAVISGLTPTMLMTRVRL